MNKFTRKDYLDGKCSHRQYYAQFAPMMADRVSHLDMNILKASKDDNFRAISLDVWDRLGEWHPFQVSTLMKELGDYPTKAGLVCILKEAALQRVEKHKA